jgi:hypothetical protein
MDAKQRTPEPRSRRLRIEGACSPIGAEGDVGGRRRCRSRRGIRIYTNDDTWNRPANLDFVIALVIGGGGGGGGCPTTGAGEQAAAAGGGAGGYALKKIAAASLGASEAVTRGAGGAGGVGGTDGSTGGTSSFGAHCSGTGGAGSGAGRDATVPGAGGSGASQLNGAASAVDGGGANGIVIVWEYLK